MKKVYRVHLEIAVPAYNPEAAENLVKNEINMLPRLFEMANYKTGPIIGAIGCKVNKAEIDEAGTKKWQQIEALFSEEEEEEKPERERAIIDLRYT